MNKTCITLRRGICCALSFMLLGCCTGCAGAANDASNTTDANNTATMTDEDAQLVLHPIPQQPAGRDMLASSPHARTIRAFSCCLWSLSSLSA